MKLAMLGIVAWIAGSFFPLQGQTLQGKMGDKSNDKVIMKSAIVAGAVDTLWWMWTTHDGLKTFFGPDNLCELRLGGPYEIYFDPENQKGEKGGEGNTILSYIPNEMLSFTWNAPPSIPEIRNQDHRTWVVVYFKMIDSTHTEVTLKHLGWLDGKEWDKTYAYFNSAWCYVMDSLVKSME